MDAIKNLPQQQHILYSSQLDTPLGQMMAIASDKALYLLEFIDRKNLIKEVEKLKITTKSSVIPVINPAIISIERELKGYFDGSLKTFTTPLHILGSNFQQLVWRSLLNIPYGQTSSYLAQASTLGKAGAFRAVANANAANQIAIVIPCHRVINNNGQLGGYAGSTMRKKWLINHERQVREKD